MYLNLILFSFYEKMFYSFLQSIYDLKTIPILTISEL